MSEVINYGEGKRLQLLKNFNMSDESFIDNEIKKGKLDTVTFSSAFSGYAVLS